MRAVVHIEAPVLSRRAKCDVLAAERLAEAPSFVPEVDEAVDGDLAHLVARRVLDRRQDLWERTRARLIPLRRRCHAESLVRPLMIITRPPFIEGALAGGEIT